jgi:hypothetical protein
VQTWLLRQRTTGTTSRVILYFFSGIRVLSAQFTLGAGLFERKTDAQEENCSLIVLVAKSRMLLEKAHIPSNENDYEDLDENSTERNSHQPGPGICGCRIRNRRRP